MSSCSAWASHCGGFSCCGAGALGHTGFSSCGKRDLSSQTRDQTRVPYTGRLIINHWTNREVLQLFLKKPKK